MLTHENNVFRVTVWRRGLISGALDEPGKNDQPWKDPPSYFWFHCIEKLFAERNYQFTKKIAQEFLFSKVVF